MKTMEQNKGIAWILLGVVACFFSSSSIFIFNLHQMPHHPNLKQSCQVFLLKVWILGKFNIFTGVEDGDV